MENVSGSPEKAPEPMQQGSGSKAPLSRQAWLAALIERHGAARQEKFSRGRVAICGLGGLGSRVAELLTRAGVGYLRLIDFDRVEATNLNRQWYFMEQLGRYKAEALAENLRRITPYVELDVHTVRITEDNLARLLADVDVIVEAFDNATCKAMLVNGVREQFPRCPLVAASGMAGFASANAMRVRRLSEHFYLCGDGSSDAGAGDGLYGARVNICSAQEAFVVLQLLAGETANVL
ncbi:MAG: sulfur carrier protein ThiS adenylyltransferase ThiF [Selenomonadaceae bacterium]|nr:sulfur carrier protein ThiS adenylyltransferase ThiF [Selenomonadaceae bacterium]